MVIAGSGPGRGLWELVSPRASTATCSRVRPAAPVPATRPTPHLPSAGPRSGPEHGPPGHLPPRPPRSAGARAAGDFHSRGLPWSC